MYIYLEEMKNLFVFELNTYSHTTHNSCCITFIYSEELHRNVISREDSELNVKKLWDKNRIFVCLKWRVYL